MLDKTVVVCYIVIERNKCYKTSLTQQFYYITRLTTEPLRVRFKLCKPDWG